MKQTFFLLLLLFAGHNARAQDSTIQYRSSGVILKLAPLSLFDPDMTVQGGVEMRVSERNAVQIEVGYGQKGWQINNDEKKNFLDWSIWRVRSEYRHYTNRYRTNTRKNINIRSPFPLGNYVAVEGLVKQISGTEIPLPPNDDPIISNIPKPVSRLIIGSHLKWGRQIAIPGASLTDLSRVLLDFYVGIGIRYGITDAVDTNDCDCGPFYDRFQPGSRFAPSLAAGVKIGFGL